MQLNIHNVKKIQVKETWHSSDPPVCWRTIEVFHEESKDPFLINLFSSKADNLEVHVQQTEQSNT